MAIAVSKALRREPTNGARKPARLREASMASTPSNAARSRFDEMAAMSADHGRDGQGEAAMNSSAAA